jgi:hypothetical protein
MVLLPTSFRRPLKTRRTQPTTSGVVEAKIGQVLALWRGPVVRERKLRGETSVTRNRSVAIGAVKGTSS